MKTIKSKADKTVKLSELYGLAAKIARANIQENGYYSYVDANTNQKIYVEP